MSVIVSKHPEIIHPSLTELPKPDPIQVWGEHFYNSIVGVEKDADLMQQAEMYGLYFGVNPQYTPALALMIKNKILGQEADQLGLSNIGRHAILTGKISELTCGNDMLRLGPDWEYVINMASYGHEYTKGLELLHWSEESEVINGQCRHKVNGSYYADYESRQPAIFQATSMQWPYEQWIHEGQAGHILLRVFDSIVGPKIMPDGTLGEDVIKPWKDRVTALELRKADASKTEGQKNHYPCTAFTYLGTYVMPALEEYLYELLKQNNSQLVGETSAIISPETPFTDILRYQAGLRNMPLQ